MKNTLGVLITYFNEKDLLNECLDTLLNQDEKPDEIIIYDDASEFPAQNYLSKNSSIRIVRGQIRKGPAVGRNILLGLSQSEYIHFHDCDDLFHRDWCRRIRQTIKDSKADLIVNEVSTYKDGKLLEDCIMNIKNNRLKDDFLEFMLSHSILTSSTTIRRSTAIKVNGYREILSQSEDYDFHIRLVASGASYMLIYEPLILKRLRQMSYSNLNQKEVWKSMIQSLELLSQELDKKYCNELSEQAIRGGAILFRLGATLEARQAFRLAHRLGQPRFEKHTKIYKILAKKFGPELVESLRNIFIRLSKNYN